MEGMRWWCLTAELCRIFHTEIHAKTSTGEITFARLGLLRNSFSYGICETGISLLTCSTFPHSTKFKWKINESVLNLEDFVFLS